MLTVDHSHETLGRDESLRLLSTAPIGRLVFTVDGLPAVRPVTLQLDGQRIVLRARGSAELVAARHRAVVAVEADEIDVATGTGWSVTVVGDARLLDDHETDVYRHDVVAVDVVVVTGRRIRPS